MWLRSILAVCLTIGALLAGGPLAGAVEEAPHPLDGAVSAPAAPATPAHGFNGVPMLTPDYGSDVETWWASHPFNPDSPNYQPTIDSPAPVLDVRAEFGGDAAAALAALPPEGGTLYFTPGAYTVPFSILGRSNVHFIGENNAVIQLNQQVQIARCNFNDSYLLPSCYTNPTQNFYFKNLIFDGTGHTEVGVDIRASRDIVFDNVTFRNFLDPRDHHEGLISAAARPDNLWCRGCHFVGNARWALYWDGTHGSGVINSRIESGFGSGDLLFLTNDDVSGDTNGNGIFDPNEIRLSRYVVVYKNSFAGGTHDAVALTGSDMLVKQNTVDGGLYHFVLSNGKSANKLANLIYHFDNVKIIGNLVHDVYYFSEHDQTSVLVSCGLKVNCATFGQFTVRDNTVLGASHFLGIAQTDGNVLGPNDVEGNCANDPSCVPTP